MRKTADPSIPSRWGSLDERDKLIFSLEQVSSNRTVTIFEFREINFYVTYMPYAI